MIRNKRDIESLVDTIGINLNSHLSFGISKAPNSLTSVIVHQSSPEDILDNLEKKA